jgi:putative transposase
MAQFNITITEELLHGLFLSNGRDEAFSKLLEEIFNQVLLAQSSEQIGAEPYERTEERTAYRNGFRDRQMTTRVGTLTLRVPRHRNGQFSTKLFARYQRSEQALVLAMMEMVINGVSTRKVELITEELCGKKFSKSTISELCKNLDPIVEAFRTRPLQSYYPFVMVDAIYVKVRENGRVQSRGMLIAIAVNEDGYREIIGFQLANSESESSWGEFFSSLKDRGLKDVRLVTSDDHKGLVNAVRKHFQGASWQRCQTHFSRNILDHTPKALQTEIKEELRQLYEAVDLESARKIRDRIIQTYVVKAPKATALLDEAFDDITAVLALPLKYRKRAFVLQTVWKG